MKLRYLFLALALFVFASRVHAQNVSPHNCSIIESTYVGGSFLPHDCSTAKWSKLINYSYGWNHNWTCLDKTNGPPGVPYRWGTANFTANGQCTQYLSLSGWQTQDCQPGYTTKYDAAPATGGNNTYYWYPFNNNLKASVFGGPTCAKVPLPAIFAQCPAVICVTRNASPVIMDLDDTGFKLTDVNDGVVFDLLGTGQPVKTAWTVKGSNTAFLALPGPDGIVHNGTQLFGDHTPQPQSNTPNGFAALAVYDNPKNGGNGDGILDARDGIWSSLRACRDLNHNGKFEPGECVPLADVGVNSIDLNYIEDHKVVNGNEFRYRTRMNPDHPDQVGKWAVDVYFPFECLQ